MNQPTQVYLDNNPSQVYLEHSPKGVGVCGLHALNNLLGQCQFSKSQLDSLAPPQPKKCGLAPTGPYPEQVLTVALQGVGYLPLRVEHSGFSMQVLEGMVKDRQAIGFLLQVQSKLSLCQALVAKLCCVRARHWCCIRRVDKRYALLDCMIDEPLYMDTIHNAINYIDSLLRKCTPVFVVVREGTGTGMGKGKGNGGKGEAKVINIGDLGNLGILGGEECQYQI